ncbi:MAG TPA: hypothetical protein PK867_31270, partial [Pirellulales bacterium]|nr:hypothetical protein [Pirellulales bacterium]
MKPLHKLTRLRQIVLTGSKVTAAGVAELQAALPNCKIDWTPTLPPPTGDPNRDAAEWVLATGGEVFVVPVGATTSLAVKNSRNLPAGPWELGAIVAPGFGIRDDDFRRLIGLPKLSTVRFGHCQISNAALAHLA